VHPLQADVNFIPILFAAYVVYAIIASLIKAARQSQAAATDATAAAPVGQGMTADDVRAALAKRRAALTAALQRQAAAEQAAAMKAPRIPQPVTLAPAAAKAVGPASIVSDLDTGAMQVLTPMSEAAAFGAASFDLKFDRYVASMPFGVQAIVASAVIGPCAAHRGAGHQPEDW
jgi:hypothetical protein